MEYLDIQGHITSNTPDWMTYERILQEKEMDEILKIIKKKHPVEHDFV